LCFAFSCCDYLTVKQTLMRNCNQLYVFMIEKQSVWYFKTEPNSHKWQTMCHGLCQWLVWGCVIGCHDVSWHVIGCHDVSWHVMMCHGVLWCVMACHGMSWFETVSWCLMMCQVWHGVSWWEDGWMAGWDRGTACDSLLEFTLWSRCS